MSFQVTEIDPSSELGTFLRSRRTRTPDSAVDASTKLFIKKLGSKENFGIIVQQNGRNGYLLYEGNDLIETKKVFIRLQQAISLLFVGSNQREAVPIWSVELLKTLVLPEPLEDKEELLERLINEADACPPNQEALCSVIESLLSETACEKRKGQETTTGAERCMLVSEEEEDESLGDKIVSIWEAITSTLSDLTGDLSSLLSELGDEMASKLDGLTRICDIRDDELGDQIWESYFTQIKDMVMDPVLQGQKIAALALHVSEDQKITLILAIKMGYIDTAMQLLLQGNNPNEFVPSIGTPLHMAVMTKREIMVKLLLVFNADPTIKNEKGKSPIDLAVPDSDIYNSLTIAKKAQAKTREYFDSHKSLPPSRKGTYLLSLDGGGIRAFNIAQYMIAVEDRMKELSPNANSFASSFDYIAGTSSGGISSLVMLYTNHSLRTGRYLSYEIITKVFRKGLSDRKRLMEEYLQGLFGTEKVMADLQKQRVIITGTLANEEPTRLHLMTNYGEPRDGQAGPKERKVWETSYITAAAPFFFPAFEKKLLDGGLMANNPNLAAMTEVIEQDEKVEFGYILSLGSGCLLEPKPVKSVNYFMPGFSLRTLLEIPNAMKGLKNLFDLFIDQVTQSDGQCVKQAQAWSKNSGWDYFRWTPPLYGLSEDISPAATDNDAIIDMLYHTQMYILDHPENVDCIAKHLLTKC